MSSALEKCSMCYAHSAYGQNNDPKVLLKRMSSHLTGPLCRNVEEKTRDQSNSDLWHKLRYGRITSSTFWSAKPGICKTTFDSIMRRAPEINRYRNRAMKRGLRLEPEIRDVVAAKLGKSIKRSGLILNCDYPEFAASPDGIGDDFVIEIKAPTHWKSWGRLYARGKIFNRYKYQLCLQMLLAKKNIGYFCIAHPNFKKTRDVTIVEIKLDMEIMKTLIDARKTTWETAIFPAL